LRAPLIFNDNYYRPGNSPIPDAGMAADLLAGSAMPTIDLVFRLKSNQPGGFVHGSMLAGTLSIEVWDGWGYWETPMPIAIQVP
jgi:hypothetical protein